MAEKAGGGASKTQPQLAEMFQKVALALKSKTLELFSDDHSGDVESDRVVPEHEAIPKPDPPPFQTQNIFDRRQQRVSPLDSQLASGLISSIFASVSSFEASYLQLQHSHAPFDEEAMSSADDSLVSLLKKLSEYKMFYRQLRLNPGSGVEFLIGSCLEAQVEDNQSKLRLLGSVSNRLQAEIDRKDSEGEALRKQLADLTKSNSDLYLKLSGSRNEVDDGITIRPPDNGIVLSVKVFWSLLNDSFSTIHKFSKVFICLMKRTGWDLDMAACSVYKGVNYSRQRHNRYAFLSYVCLTMFRGFDDRDYGLSEVGSLHHCLMKELLEHVSTIHHSELLSKDSGSLFAKFCDKKYQELVHHGNLFSASNNGVISSWKSLNNFYDSFLAMASATWALHKLAFCFDPAVEIFQIERGADFSMVFMEDITRNMKMKMKMPLERRPKVGFTVVPGFKIGLTVIQSQVYLSASN